MRRYSNLGAPIGRKYTVATDYGLFECQVHKLTVRTPTGGKGVAYKMYCQRIDKPKRKGTAPEQFDIPPKEPWTAQDVVNAFWAFENYLKRKYGFILEAAKKNPAFGTCALGYDSAFEYHARKIRAWKEEAEKRIGRYGERAYPPVGREALLRKMRQAEEGLLRDYQRCAHLLKA